MSVSTCSSRSNIIQYAMCTSNVYTPVYVPLIMVESHLESG